MENIIFLISDIENIEEIQWNLPMLENDILISGIYQKIIFWYHEMIFLIFETLIYLFIFIGVLNLQ